ncbi:WzyE family oligosaccharide polymerase, partial [Klebsiella quasipneumoniae]|uniref:WzyE family oligosaccharide polymerase n=1 Tax=Klebsiella quasipneumoniae TaxID=1463165 RepID=UPI00344F0A11
HSGLAISPTLIGSLVVMGGVWFVPLGAGPLASQPPPRRPGCHARLASRWPVANGAGDASADPGGGLRESQAIGDYVLAHAYLRDDHVLDAVLPPD